ncbi:hypothetical protein L1281_000813 [Neisseria sp. HSC-16F19]|nr:hypothetical protein [Neisseria sp. HSC-16F19]MCP2040231.1 hypothetical protein [Neisseria sp. HSC-16F19]
MMGLFKKTLQEFFNGEEFQKLLASGRERQQREEALREEAPWFGRTGLSDEDERELPRYLRREYGEDIFSDPHALKAAELYYLGQAALADGSVGHYWQVPGSEVSYAAVYCYADGSLHYSCWAEPPPQLLPTGEGGD